jgi:hypothetical protein
MMFSPQVISNWSKTKSLHVTVIKSGLRRSLATLTDSRYKLCFSFTVKTSSGKIATWDYELAKKFLLILNALQITTETYVSYQK